jgi:endonuclease G
VRAWKKLKKSTVSMCAAIAALLGWSVTNLSSGSNFRLHQELCLDQFYQNTAPELINPKLQPNSHALCFNGFSLNYSGISKTPLWVAEYLSPQRLASKIAREDHFHEEHRLEPQARSSLEDYRGSGYDRGHMAPNGDMPDTAAQFDSFSLANISPQTPENNQNTWREIEESVRSMVSKYQLDAYVVTGPIYAKKQVKTIQAGHKVLVPSHFYKAVYFPKTGMASAYISANDQSKTAKVVSICALEEQTGINIFPRLEENRKRQVFALPMQARDVKAKRQPNYLHTDLPSQCASTPSEQQIKATQQLFVLDDAQPHSTQPAARAGEGQQSRLNWLLTALLEWLIQHEKQ